jgi:hypothetical protein
MWPPPQLEALVMPVSAATVIADAEAAICRAYTRRPEAAAGLDRGLDLRWRGWSIIPDPWRGDGRPTHLPAFVAVADDLDDRHSVAGIALVAGPDGRQRVLSGVGSRWLTQPQPYAQLKAWAVAADYLAWWRPDGRAPQTTTSLCRVIAAANGRLPAGADAADWWAPIGDLEPVHRKPAAVQALEWRLREQAEHGGAPPSAVLHGLLSEWVAYHPGWSTKQAISARPQYQPPAP